MVRKTKENIWIPILTWSGLKTRDVSLVLLSSGKGLGLGLKATIHSKPLPSKTLIIIFYHNASSLYSNPLPTSHILSFSLVSFPSFHGCGMLDLIHFSCMGPLEGGDL